MLKRLSDMPVGQLTIFIILDMQTIKEANSISTKYRDFSICQQLNEPIEYQRICDIVG